MEALSKGEALHEQISAEIVDLISQFKQKVIDLVHLVDTITQRCYEEKLNDHDVWLLLQHALENVEISAQQKRKILAPFRPPKPLVWTGTETYSSPSSPQKRMSSMETFEGNFEFACPLSVIDPNIAVAKQKLIGMIRVLEDTFYLKTTSYKFSNIKPDKTDQWIVPEGTEDETFIS